MRSRTADKTEGARSDEVIALHPAESGMQLGRALLHALHNAGISVLYQDREMKTVWARNMRAPWISDNSDGNGILPMAQADRISTAKREDMLKAMKGFIARHEGRMMEEPHKQS